MKTEFDLSVIVPCLNEAENISETLQWIIVHTAKISNCKTEIIVVDDNSSDNTYDISTQFKKDLNENELENITVSVIRRELNRRGYGAVVRHGIAYARGRYAIFVSADRVDPIEYLNEFYVLMESGYDLVQCSRYTNEGDTNTIPFIYKFYQFFYRRLVKIILRTDLKDTTYAFKMFRRRKTLAIGLSQNRFSISPEITFKTLLAGGKITSFAAPQGVRVYGQSKFSFIKEAFGYSYVLLRALLHRTGIVLWF